MKNKLKFETGGWGPYITAWVGKTQVGSISKEDIVKYIHPDTLKQVMLAKLWEEERKTDNMVDLLYGSK